MAKLPDRSDLGVRLPGAARGMPSFPTSSPVASALLGLGETGQRVGFGMMQERQKEIEKARLEAEREEEFGVHSRFIQFDNAQREWAAQRSLVAPSGAAGFTDSLAPDGNRAMQDFLKTVPDRLKAEYANKLTSTAMSIRSWASDFETGERQRYKIQTAAETEELLLQRQTDPNTPWESVRADGEKVWATSGLPAPVVDEKLREWRQRHALALFEQRQARDPAGARAQLGVAGATNATGIAAGILREREGFRETAYWDVNAQRVGYGSDTVTRADGSIERVGKDTVVSREDAERDLARRIKEFAGAAERQIGPSWSSLSPATQGALTSVAYNYGTIPNRIVPAVRSGDPEAIAQAIESLGGDNDGVNRDRRKYEADVVRSAGAGVAVEGSSPAPEYADLPYETRQKLYEESRAAQEKVTTRDLEDYTAYLRAGNVGEPVKYSMPGLQAIYGPERGAELYQEVERAVAYGQDVAAVQWATPAEQQALVEERARTLASSTDFRANLQDVEGLLSVIKARNEALVSDPARFVQKDPEIAAAYEAIGSATEPREQFELSRNYAEAVLAKQEHLGMPPRARRILPQAFAQEIADRFTDQGEGGQNAAVMMRALEAQWGKHWPMVFGQIATDAKLPGTALVIGAMNRPDQLRAAEKLAEAAQIGTKALEDTLPNETVKTTKESVAVEMEEFALTLANNPGATETYSTFQEGIYQLALAYVRQGDAADRAAKRAYDDVIGKKYTIMETYRVPIEYDAEAVSDNAESLIASMTGDGIAIPPSLAGLNAEQAKDAYMSALRAQGFWVTAPDESGLVLYDGDLRAVMTSRGEPATFSWQEILSLRQSRRRQVPKALQPFSEEINRMGGSQ